MSYTQLTMMQRYQIEALKKEGLNQSAIARNLGVHRSTICRELKRNSLDSGEYLATSAQISTRLRYQHKKKNKRLSRSHIIYIRKHLQEEWSPEQISGRMKLDGLKPISHETIYRYIYQDKQQGGKLYTFLQHKNRKYHKRSCEYRSRGQIIDRTPIDKRPEIANEKQRVGDWEVDTIIGKNHQQGIVTIVDRKSKFTLMKKVKSKQAVTVTRAMIQLLEPIKDHVHTITSDNGKEFAYHKEVSNRLNAGFYFAKPYQSWQRGLNEHTNGLIRQYFPKKRAFDTISDRQIVEVQNKLNNRPRKVLGYKTPTEVFFATITQTYSAVDPVVAVDS
ncbi:IS30 family transposase [Hydrogenimonas thermophila]|uniref:IS30 family transposase n=1 Tax=Hydrogenimonas thermophila TaxID=223786 RepID=UPI0029371B99|nr:IS30 family transposase [Hydrogenimonas thermophila]WOE69336.1 IS30 family transposase [Hydrogenimonas thermophila]WOE71846.1 IS30 family transposase [Hydrogenimonas thermophila]